MTIQEKKQIFYLDHAEPSWHIFDRRIYITIASATPLVAH